MIDDVFEVRFGCGGGAPDAEFRAAPVTEFVTLVLHEIHAVEDGCAAPQHVEIGIQLQRRIEDIAAVFMLDTAAREQRDGRAQDLELLNGDVTGFIALQMDVDGVVVNLRDVVHQARDGAGTEAAGRHIGQAFADDAEHVGRAEDQTTVGRQRSEQAVATLHGDVEQSFVAQLREVRKLAKGLHVDAEQTFHARLLARHQFGEELVEIEILDIAGHIQPVGLRGALVKARLAVKLQDAVVEMGFDAA